MVNEFRISFKYLLLFGKLFIFASLMVSCAQLQSNGSAPMVERLVDFRQYPKVEEYLKQKLGRDISNYDALISGSDGIYDYIYLRRKSKHRSDYHLGSDGSSFTLKVRRSDGGVMSTILQQ